MWPYLLSKFLRNIINFLLSENAVSPMNGKAQGPFGSPRFFMKKKVTRITATLVRNKMYDSIVSIVVTKYFDFKNRVLNFFFFFFTSFQYRIALLLNLRDNNRGFMNHQSVFRLRKATLQYQKLVYQTASLVPGIRNTEESVLRLHDILRNIIQNFSAKMK